jgi:hypothetical protein
MLNSPQYRWHDAARRCAVCDGKLGLIRHYSWRTAKKRTDRFKAREEGDRRWLDRLQAAGQTVLEAMYTRIELKAGGWRD